MVGGLIHVSNVVCCSDLRFEFRSSFCIKEKKITRHFMRDCQFVNCTFFSLDSLFYVLFFRAYDTFHVLLTSLFFVRFLFSDVLPFFGITKKWLDCTASMIHACNVCHFLSCTTCPVLWRTRPYAPAATSNARHLVLLRIQFLGRLEDPSNVASLQPLARVWKFNGRGVFSTIVKKTVCW